MTEVRERLLIRLGEAYRIRLSSSGMPDRG
jgi:hypothetical protein